MLNDKGLLFSVIIPTYNRRAFLEIAVPSVLNQTYSSLELIIIDDGSTDQTEDWIKHNRDARLVYKRQKNSGVAFARNQGLSLAQGDFIAFLDSDDRWVPNKLQRTYECIQQYPHISIFHTEEVWYRNGKILEQKNKHKKPSGYVYKNALPLCCISISTVAIKRNVFDAVGGFDENFEACEDYEFWLRVTHQYHVQLIPEYLTLKDGGRADQLSSKIWGLDRFRIKALEKMLLSKKLDDEEYESTYLELKKKCLVFAKGAKKRGKAQVAQDYLNLINKYHRI